jgi:7-keto-8-aminopelargonate synthetase-like enzyme
MQIDGKPYVNFFGSGYLALSNIPEIRARVLSELESGAPFSRQVAALLESKDPIFDGVEQAGAHACGTEASVYFPSGYLVGIIGLASFNIPSSLMLVDESAHYSLKDAVRLTAGAITEFRHCDAEALEEALKREIRPDQVPVVVTDGIFATTGRLPPLSEYAALLEPYRGRIFIDESHAFGVVGELGRGAGEYCAVEYLGSTGSTLSKAYCAQGALVGCSAEVAARLRWLPQVRGACAGSPLSAAAAAAGFEYMKAHPERRATLRDLSDYLRARIRGLGIECTESPAPIVSFTLPTQDDMLAVQRRLFAHGFHIQYSTYIGAGPSGMLRCAVFADHSREDIDGLIDLLSLS